MSDSHPIMNVYLNRIKLEYIFIVLQYALNGIS